MTKRINIKNLRISLPRALRHDAHSVARTIGNDIARRVAIAASGRSGTFQVGEISVGRVQDISAVGEKAATKVRQILGSRGRK
jgi:hypothetical protein